MAEVYHQVCCGQALKSGSDLRKSNRTEKSPIDPRTKIEAKNANRILKEDQEGNWSQRPSAR